MKVLVATDKPFAKEAVDGIKQIIEKAGMEFALLEKYTSQKELCQAAKDVDAMIVRSDKVTQEVIDAAENLKIVVRAGAGYDNLDLQACCGRKIVAMNTPGQNSNAVAELAIAMMIFMARGQFTPAAGSEIKDKTLGIHAYGNVGSLVANYGKAFGMKVYAFDPYANPAALKNDGVEQVSTVEELYEKSNFVSLHIPSTPQTKNSINKDLVGRMPKGAMVINTARKDVINEAELLELMKQREDLKYATDVAPDTDFSEVGNRFFATPKKMGAQTMEANVNAGLAAANQIVDFLQNGVNKFQVNKF